MPAARDYIGCIRGIPETELVFCVLPDDKKDRYDAIKQLTSCEKPTPSQLILAKTCKKVKVYKTERFHPGVMISFRPSFITFSWPHVILFIRVLPHF